MCQSFDWSHIATLFIQSSGRAVYTLVYSNPLIKIKQKARTFNQNYSKENMCEHTLTNICDSRKSAGKTEGLLYLQEYLPIFCFCPESCTSCVRLWGYIQGRGAHSSHFLLFYIIFMSTIMNGDGNFVCVLFRIFISKKQRIQKQKHRKLQFY